MEMIYFACETKNMCSHAHIIPNIYIFTVIFIYISTIMLDTYFICQTLIS